MLALLPSGTGNTTVMKLPDLFCTDIPWRRSARATSYSSTVISAGVGRVLT